MRCNRVSIHPVIASRQRRRGNPEHNLTTKDWIASITTLSRNDESGLTLFEMTLVLMIIGLIVGGIFVGQSMIRQAQIRNVVSEFDIYGKAIKEFQDKYQALPGDMNNATAVWGAAATANGDGNGTIGASTTAGAVTNTAGGGGIANAGEWYLAWQQLALAGFIPGSFTGTTTDGITAVIGSNVPASKLGAGWTILYYLNTPGSGDVGLWGDQYGHIMSLGNAMTGSYTTSPALTPAEALSLDQKLDDGMPGTGNIRAWRTSLLPNCTVSDTSQTAQAYSNDSSQDCSLVFLLGF